MTRRELIQKVFVGGTTIVMVPSAIEACTKISLTGGDGFTGTLTIDLTKSAYSTLNTAGAYIVTNSVIVVNTGNNLFIALSAICTHQGCTVGYDSTHNDIVCPCHGSVFSTTGNVLVGPAPYALASYNVIRNGDILTITG